MILGRLIVAMLAGATLALVAIAAGADPVVAAIGAWGLAAALTVAPPYVEEEDPDE